MGCVSVKCEYAAVVTDCSICPLARLGTRTVVQVHVSNKVQVNKTHKRGQELVNGNEVSVQIGILQHQ